MSRVSTTIAAIATPQNTALSGSISGRLILRNGKPGAGRRILALSAREGPAAGSATVMSLTETDAQGRFLLQGVPPGRYTIATGLLDELTFFPGTVKESQATVVMVTAGGKAADVDFRLNTVRVSGRVIGDVEALVPTQGRGGGATALFRGSDLQLGSDSGAPKTPVDRDGAFQFGAVLPGTYRPMAANSGVGIVSAEIIVGDDDVSGVQLRAARRMNFPVTVTVEGGGPTPPLRLRFEEAKPAERTTPVMVEAVAKDSFEVGLLDLQFRLVVPEAPPGFILKSATLVYPSGGTTSILQKPFIVHQVARLAIVLGRDGQK